MRWAVKWRNFPGPSYSDIFTKKNPMGILISAVMREEYLIPMALMLDEGYVEDCWMEDE
jgi:hypothetical protein